MTTTDWIIAISACITAIATGGLVVFNILNLKEVRRIQKESVRPNLVLKMFRRDSPTSEYVIHVENFGKWYALNIRARLSLVDKEGRIRIQEYKLEMSKNTRIGVDEVGIAYISFIPRNVISSYEEFDLGIKYDSIFESNLSKKLSISLSDIKTLSSQQQGEMFVGRHEVELGRTIIDLAKV